MIRNYVLIKSDYIFQYGRTYTTQAGGYRYGFNGKENDNEVKGEGNSLDFGERIYDSRLGRWLSIDPLQAKYPNLSPYCAFANNPIYFIDPTGGYFTGNTATVKAVYSKVCMLAKNGDKRAIEYKALLEKMDESDIEFNVQNSNQHISSMKYDGKGGETNFDFENNRVVMDVYTFTQGQHVLTYEQRAGHELEHGGQFLEGDIDFAENEYGTGLGNSGDYYDEHKACEIENMLAEPGTSLTDEQLEKRVEGSYGDKLNKSDYKASEARDVSAKKAPTLKNYISKYTYKPTDKQVEEKKKTGKILVDDSSKEGSSTTTNSNGSGVSPDIGVESKRL